MEEEGRRSGTSTPPSRVPTSSPVRSDSTSGTTPDVNKRDSNSHLLVSPLPSNAIIFRPPDQQAEDSSFHHYIDTQFDPSHGGILKNRLSLQNHDDHDQCHDDSYSHTLHQDSKKPSESTLRNSTTRHENDPALATFWAALAQDLHKKTANQGYQFHPTTYDEENQQDLHENPWWTSSKDEDGIFSIGALLFLFGFICPPLWWIGSFLPRHPRERGGKMAERWQKLNRAMSIGFSIILILAIIITVAVWKGT